MLGARKRTILRAALLAALIAFIALSVLTPLLERPQYVSRQGPWAREALGQPLPLRLSDTIGHWSISENSSSPASPDAVTYVKMLAVGQQIEEFSGDTAPVCSDKEKQRFGCVVWSTRGERRRQRGSADDGHKAKEILSGNVVTHFNVDAIPTSGNIPLSTLRLTLQVGTIIGAVAYDVDAVSQWNDTETTTATQGEMRWVSFGARTRSGRQELQSLFPNESGKGEDDTSNTVEERRRKMQNGFQPAVSYFRGTLNSTDAVRLFANLYLRKVAQQEEEEAKKKKKDKDAGETEALTYGNVLSSKCFWLTEVVYKDLRNAAGVVEGRAWSTCGDRMTWTGDADAFEALVSEANLIAFLVLFTTALPMVAGTVYQMWWMRNSRTRALRVNPYQLMLTAFMLSLSTYLLSASANYAPSAVSRIIGSSKPTFILYGVVFVAEMLLFFMYFAVDREFTNYFQASENARAEASRRIFVFFFLIWIGPSIVVAVGGLHNPWVTGIMASVFWLPQYIHCFTMDGWTGLTAPFITANLALVLTPLLAPLLAPAPWTMPRSHVVAVLVGASVLVLQGGLLLALRLNDGKNLIPRWMAPWRHVYKTTVEAQRAALLENPLCPVCRNQLAEGWDEHDELWRTPCNHLFHRSCLERWMQERTECPLCRKLLPEP